MRPMRPALRSLGLTWLRRGLLVGALAAAALAVAGCRDVLDLNDRAIVIAVGLDAGDSPEQVDVAVAVAAPGQGAAGGGGGGGGMAAPPGMQFRLIVRSAPGRTVEEALVGINPGLGRRIYLGNTALVVIGEELARRGVRPWLDHFIRSSDFPLKAWVVVVEGRARDFLAAPSDETGFQVMDVLETFERGAPRQVLTHNLRFWQFYDRLVAPHRDPWCAYVVPLAQSHLMDGLAVFSGDRLAGVLRDEEATAFGWFLPEPFTPHVFVLPPEGPGPGGAGGPLGLRPAGETVALRLKLVRTTVSVASPDPKRLAARVRADVFVVEGLPVTEGRTADVRAWEAQAAAAVAGMVDSMWDQLKAWRADPLGFSETFRRRDPRLVDAWREELGRVELDVTADLVFRLGLRGRTGGP